ncbi:MAG TPA: S41 family peptidase [Chitinophaga sp.]|uniref:S41 family peptidase n=1 Tax=Chitinophaga sp. TaxID=1869181 RepID=UPI002C83A46F|nr:S41 family peptidase [Chitinophaga sp.]HVI46904.1 S41 family peptidase [Chitinophaga sp.]
MKHLKKYIIALVALSAVIISSCRKEIPQLNRPEDYVAANFNEVFDAYWTGMNNNYVFWDIDTTDWDRVYKTYKPLFAKLNLYDEKDVRKSYTYFKEMTAGLVDSHYDLSFRDQDLMNDSGSISPAFERKVKSPDYHPSIRNVSLYHFYDTIPRKYLDPTWKRGFTNLPNDQVIGVAGTINQNILYFYFSGFNLTDLYNDSTNATNRFRLAEKYFFDLLQSTPNIKGIILDVRGNGGGSLADLDFLLGRMIDKPLHFGYTRSKQGNGRLDYSPWAPAYVKPQPGAKAVAAPIVVLADAWSVSMAEITTMAVKTLPNGHFVGERTWGGNGPLTGNKFYQGGQFTTGFFNLVYTSSLMFKNLDGKIYEGVGYPPEKEVKFNAAALKSGRDMQLEAAIGLIR